MAQSQKPKGKRGDLTANHLTNLLIESRESVEGEAKGETGRRRGWAGQETMCNMPWARHLGHTCAAWPDLPDYQLTGTGARPAAVSAADGGGRTEYSGVDGLLRETFAKDG